MYIDGQTFIQKFEEFCPQYLAEKGDPVGLQIGTLNKEIHSVMITLDVRPEVVAEAIEKKIDLLIAKHPPIFRPIQTLSTTSIQNKMYADLLKNDITVYAAHTNLDIIPNGLNDWFCEKLDVEETEFLKETHRFPCKKLAVYVPKTAAEEMRQKLAQAGAGQIGLNYLACSYSQSGIGRFTPVNHAIPAIGHLNQEERVEEEKIEVVFSEEMEERILSAMLQAHPYEEPAYDLYPLENNFSSYGLGRIGNIKEAMSVEAFTEKVKNCFELDGLRLVNPDPNRLIKRVAICGGSGEKFYLDALKKGADIYITGDVYYHTAHDMLSSGLTVLDPGHYIEQLCKEKLYELFDEWNSSNGWELKIFQSESNTNPFEFH